jgi:tRNA (guanine-N7-)-methyltransferase
MPHIIIDKVKDLNFPQKSGDVEFLFKAEDLIAVKTPNAKFLIKIQKRDNGYLVKYDKITRPVISEIKKAYEEFVKLNEANILFENIKGIKPKLPSRFLLDITSNLSKIDIIEIGFGSGRHLIHLAKKYPNKIILGIEIHKPSIEQVLKRLEHEKIDNVRILNHDARIILSKINSNQLEKIFLHFPVPWDKKPHRRVMNKDFLNETIRTLKKEGIFHLRTDSIKYFNYSLNLLLDFEKIDFEIKKNIPYDVSSKYEDRWKKLNKDIFDIYLYNHEISEDLKEEFDFSFEKKLKNFDFKPKVFENFVVHIEKIYKIDDNNEIVKATIGNFNRPEHVYILNKEKPEYFKMPAPIKDNFLAHQQLKRLFNGDNC